MLISIQNAPGSVCVSHLTSSFRPQGFVLLFFAIGGHENSAEKTSSEAHADQVLISVRACAWMTFHRVNKKLISIVVGKKFRKMNV